MMQDICDEDNTQYFDLDLGGITPKYLEVIGNIYENKELLEVE
ncbi:YopX family protein [Intestinibacter bartlettii]